MSVVVYNGVTLPYAYATDFRQSAAYDDMGNTDRAYMRIDATYQCVIHTNYLAGMLQGGGLKSTTNPADLMKQLRYRLLTPRRRLSITFNGTELIPQNNLEGQVDSRNGPQPQACQIFPLSDTTFLLTWSVVAHYWETQDQANQNSQTNEGSEKDNNPVLYNRWSETAAIDNENYTVRTRRGKFVIRSDNYGGKIADEIRAQMAVVGVPPGFLRRSSSYTVDPSGLALEYELVDREVFKLPPPPAFDADGEYTETTTNGGATRHCEVWCKLRGDKTTSQAALITTCVTVCTAKLGAEGAGTTLGANGQLGPIGQRGMLEYGIVRVKLYENEVFCHLRVRTDPRWVTAGGTPATATYNYKGIAGIDFAKIGFTPLSDTAAIGGAAGAGAVVGLKVGPNYKTFGTAGLLLQAAAYYDPSLASNKVLPATGNFEQGMQIGQAGLSNEET